MPDNIQPEYRKDKTIVTRKMDSGDPKNSIIVGNGSSIVPWVKMPEKILKGNCKLCNSKYREEAEELYDKVGNVKRVEKFLVEERMEDISYTAVHNHLVYHHEIHSINAKIQACSKEIEEWVGQQDDQITAMKRAMAMLEREMFFIASANDGLILSERRKNDDLMIKYAAQLLAYRAKIEEMESEKQPINIVYNQLSLILKNELNSANDPNLKVFVKNVLSKLQNQVQELEE